MFGRTTYFDNQSWIRLELCGCKVGLAPKRRFQTAVAGNGLGNPPDGNANVVAAPLKPAKTLPPDETASTR